jgi:lipid-binding SYLF domain-containing protein
MIGVGLQGEGMNYLFQRRVIYTLSLMLVLGLVSAPTFAQNRGKEAREASRRSADAADVFKEIMGAPDRAIPKDLVDKAQAIAVFPGVLKAAFIFGGREGKGVISRRTASGWSAPAYFKLAGGSFGAQIGADKTDYVLLIMNEDGLNKLMSDKFELGGSVGVAAGPVGRELSAATDVELTAEILTYSRSKGAFIGASLNGSTITPDNALNEAVYGLDARDVLRSGVNSTPYALLTYPRTLSRY